MNEKGDNKSQTKHFLFIFSKMPLLCIRKAFHASKWNEQLCSLPAKWDIFMLYRLYIRFLLIHVLYIITPCFACELKHKHAIGVMHLASHEILNHIHPAFSTRYAERSLTGDSNKTKILPLFSHFQRNNEDGKCNN